MRHVCLSNKMGFLFCIYDTNMDFSDPYINFLFNWLLLNRFLVIITCFLLLKSYLESCAGMATQ